MGGNSGMVWRVIRALLPPLILGALVFLTLREPLAWWIQGEQIYDQEAIREWVREARVYTTLPELVQSYLELGEKYQLLLQKHTTSSKGAPTGERNQLEYRLTRKREEIFEHLKALGNPPTKMYPGQLPLFPIIYRLTVTFDSSLGLTPIGWDSELPRQISQYHQLDDIAIHPKAAVSVQYHLHAYMERQFKERQEIWRRLRLSGLGIIFALLALLWVYLSQRRERDREHQRLVAQQQVNEAERLRLQEELRRQEAETREQDMERQNLELRSQIFANIGIMAGSYAHNIKNLLVRPNDLLRRCLEESLPADHQGHMLREIKQTLGTVTERLQQILQTVRRDPSKAEKVRIDLNQMVQEMQQTWAELAREKWKMDLEVDLWQGDGDNGPAPLWIEGDLSHLQQALENLLFNARDATFEMRNHLREQARQLAPQASADSSPPLTGGEKPGRTNSRSHNNRKALIAAAAWKGLARFRTRRQEDRAILEIQDNGIGMTAEIRRRCTETHFSTKRNNALFAGLSAGMGLGLAFVTVILEHHGARLEIDSEPFQGATFRVSFPVANS
jgi:signal transduction histidine kinase